MSGLNKTNPNPLEKYSSGEYGKCTCGARCVCDNTGLTSRTNLNKESSNKTATHESKK